ncbi:SRPBCC family protein [Kitasatospora sp. NPDC101157]|uniref:SRPBCC family protein n=1 Tax=Kitasatospora sp. NPDC101157 TaxID=3364098 RepID=UPI003812FBA3
MADNPKVEVDVQVAAPPTRVWALVSNITTPTRFGGELYEAEWLDGATGPEVGATFVGRNRAEQLGSWETVSRISDCRPDQAFGWEVRGRDGDFSRPVALWRFDLEPAENGTRLRQSFALGPGSSYLHDLIASHPDREEEIVDMRLAMLEEAMKATLDGIRELAES